MAEKSSSSKRWLARQHKDPYVAAAKRDGWRSRAAYKLLELDERFHLLRPGQSVLDLGAAPGGWSEVAAKALKLDENGTGRVVAVDILPMESIGRVTILTHDFMSEDAPATIIAACGGKVDLVLSDMAPSTIGHAQTDHWRQMALAEAAADLIPHILKKGGSFVCKTFQGGDSAAFFAKLKSQFTTIRRVKPEASRKDSVEMFILAQGFKG